MHVSLVVRTFALLLIAGSLAGACADLGTSQTAAPGSPTPPPSSSPSSSADCVVLGAVTPVLVASLAVTELGDGTKRIVSAEGGYSLVVPSEWIVSGSLFGGVAAAFGQVHMSSYDRAAVPTPRPEAGSILPPEVGVRLDVEVWANPSREPPDAYSRRLHIGPDQVAVLPGSFVTLNGQRAYRTTLQDERRFQPQTGALIVTRQTRTVWILPTPRSDRMLVLYATTPAESALRSAVERAVSTLEVTAPASAILPVVRQRSEILGEWLVGKSGPIPGRRVEAKLMTYAEASVALHPSGTGTPMGILRIDRDPDELFWLVAVSGPDLPQGRGGPMSSATPPPTTWLLYNVSATTQNGGGTGRAYSASGTWPPGFDALPDRCR